MSRFTPRRKTALVAAAAASLFGIGVAVTNNASAATPGQVVAIDDYGDDATACEVAGTYWEGEGEYKDTYCVKNEALPGSNTTTFYRLFGTVV